MTKHDNCKSQSSDDSDVGCKDKCKKDCHFKECKCYSPEELVCMYHDAVVEIHSEFILLGTGTTGNSPVSSATGGSPLEAQSRTDVILEGNGFFIKGHYIVTPAQLVLMPPSLTSVVNRYPFFDPNDLTLGTIKDQMIRASRVLVSVFNVNGKGHSFVYEAELVGVDGAGDIAVLRINYKKQWNQCNPCIERCHPVFKFGSSRGAKDGEKVYLIGDYVSNASDRRLFNAAGTISGGLLSDHRYVDYSGYSLAELVLVNAASYAFSAGLPVIDCRGNVIGMQTTDLAAVVPGVTGNGYTPKEVEGAGLVSGPSEFFMRRVIKALIKGSCCREYYNQVETICDPAGAYYRYKKGYAGVAYDIFSGIDYDVTVDYISGGTNSGFPRIRLSSNGSFLNSPTCKELVGIRVLGLAGINPEDSNSGITNGYWYVPGGTGSSPLVSFLPSSPLLGKLLPGDVITHIKGIALGDLHKQISPSLITWRLCSGELMEITYRRGGNASNASDNSLTDDYGNVYSDNVCLTGFPLLMDYPWYAVNIFPLIVNRGFIFPATQISNPQLPQLSAGASFHPAF